MECVSRERATALEYMWETAYPVKVTNILKLLFFRILLSFS